MNLLIVDASSPVLRPAADALAAGGHHLLRAENPKEAEWLLAHQPVDAVLFDSGFLVGHPSGYVFQFLRRDPDENGAVPPAPGQLITIDELEQEHIRRVIERVGNLERAARILGIDTTTLYRKRKRMGLGRGAANTSPASLS